MIKTKGLVVMRKYVYGSWIVLIFTFSGILAYSTLFEIDSYQTVVDFRFQVSEVTISVNETNFFKDLSVVADISNPSLFSSIRLKSIESTVSLNQQTSEYLRELHWFMIIIPPGENASINWGYEIIRQNEKIFISANTSSAWNWSFEIKVNLVSSIIEEGQYDRSQDFQGVTILET